jgi:hypothetical protein
MSVRQSHEHGLCLIVGMMTQEQCLNPVFLTCCSECLIPKLARLRLEIREL